MGSMKLYMACVCHMGRVRGNNEDNFYFAGEMLEEENVGLDVVLYYTGIPNEAPETVAVFDGIGGEVGGEVAAFAAARALKSLLASQRMTDPAQCLFDLNQAVNQARASRHMQSAGCTAVLAHFTGKRVVIANLGDSPAFLFRNGQLEKLSQDHTDAKLLHELGITNRKPKLTQYLGVNSEEFDLEPHIATRELDDGDILLLCSDGLTDMVTDQEIIEQLSSDKSAEDVSKALLKLALTHGGIDNTTIVVAMAEK